jgi:hypothetical protein
VYYLPTAPASGNRANANAAKRRSIVTLSITVGSGVPDDQLPPGNYPASLKSVVEKTIEVKGENRDVYEWTFLVPTQDDDGQPGDPISVSGLSSQMTGPKSKTAAFLVALLGPSAVQPGATFTMNDLIGKQCLIQTDLNDAGYHKVVGATPLPVTSAVRPTNRAAVGEATPAGPVAASVAPESGVASVPQAPKASAEDPDADLPF